MKFNFLLKLIVIISSLILSNLSYAHHVLGRPSYSLNENSNTPPSMAIEIQIGDYFVTTMVFPAFPKPNEAGRLNLYATRIDNGITLLQPVTFSVRDETFFGDIFNFGKLQKTEIIGVQEIDDGVYRQGFVFNKKGNYIIRAHFEDGGEDYDIDFPLQVGTTNAIGPVGVALGSIFFLLISINIFQRRRIIRSKIQQGRQSL